MRHFVQSLGSTLVLQRALPSLLVLSTTHVRSLGRHRYSLCKALLLGERHPLTLGLQASVLQLEPIPRSARLLVESSILSEANALDKLVLVLPAPPPPGLGCLLPACLQRKEGLTGRIQFVLELVGSGSEYASYTYQPFGVSMRFLFRLLNLF